MYEILRYTCDCCNAFFRRLYEYGTWMPASEAAILVPLGYGMTAPWPQQCFFSKHEAVELVKSEWRAFGEWSEEGYAAMARLANDRSFKLYRMKPKLHMLDHITWRNCNKIR